MLRETQKLDSYLAHLLLGIWIPMAPNRFLLTTGKLRKQRHLTLRSGGFILAMLLSACVSRAHRIYLAACQESHTNNGGRMTSSSKLKCSQCVLTVCKYVYQCLLCSEFSRYSDTKFFLIYLNPKYSLVYAGLCYAYKKCLLSSCFCFFRCAEPS